MNGTNFRFTKLERSKRGRDEVLWLRASYDLIDGMLKDRPAQLEVQYTLGDRPELKSVRLDMHYLIPTPKSTVYFVDNKPTRIETWNPYPSMDTPKDSTRKINRDHLRGDLDYKAMIGLIPDSEPVKPALEDIVW